MHFDTRGIKRFCRGVCCKIIISECLISDLDNVQLGNQWKLLLYYASSQFASRSDSLVGFQISLAELTGQISQALLKRFVNLID
jgi:hypothetical protein